MRHSPSHVLAFFLSVSLPVFALFLAGCPSTQRTLDPAGAYAGDTMLWTVDGLIVDADRVFSDVLAFADRNPAYVASQPALAEFVAKVRTQRDAWLRDVFLARDAYATARSATTLATLQGRIDFLRSLLEQARPFLARPPDA